MMERTPNLYFPLHQDVLRAALRELFLLDGRIDARTLKIVYKKKSSVELVESCGSGGDSVGPSVEQRKSIGSGSGATNIIPVEKDADFDYSRFKHSEGLVERVLSQAVETHAEIAKHELNGCISDGKEISSCESASFDNSKDVQTVASKRKVSDADEQDGPISVGSFPSHVMELVQSNILELQRSAVSSTSGQNCSASTLTASSRLFPVSDTINSEVQNAIVTFLRYPRIQKLQKQHGDTSPFFVLPRLLNVSIIAESYLRKAAHAMASSILDSIPGNDFDIPLRIFLGYKTNKTMSRAQLVNIFSQVLFDVSHAMYAWVQTEHEMKMLAAKNGEDLSVSAINKKSIKQSLFDKRALRLIGGFEPSSLLPLALGIRDCRENNISWEEYAVTVEGRAAMKIHLPRDFVGNAGDRSSQKRQFNPQLFEVGKRRKGRRGRSLRHQKDVIDEVAD